MPTYRFFEAAKTSANQDKAGQRTQFEEFNLSTRERSQSRKRKSITAQETTEEVQLRKIKTYTFKASKMPDFSDTYNGVKPPSPKKLTSFTPFNLSTVQRGEEKEAKFKQTIEAEELKLKNSTQFKATPLKEIKGKALASRVKSDKKTTKAVGITLSSSKRSVKREQFNEELRQKEILKAEQKALEEQERLK